MNILITGGAGFIGSHIADACIAEGHSVTIVDDLSTGKMDNVNDRAEFIRLDIRGPNLAQILEDNRFDVVFHHAAQMDVRRSVSDPLFDASVNIVGSINLLEHCRRTGVRKFIFASTGGAIYGEQDYFPADESHPNRPLSPYGIAKLATEKYLYYYNRVYGLQYVCLRYANVYGPRQNPHGEAGVVAIFTGRMLAGEQPTINGDGKQTRDYTFVEDVVRANLLALQYPGSDIFNVGTKVETNVNEVFHALNELTKCRAKEVHGPAKEGEQLRSVLDYSKIERALGWTPKIALREGLARTVQYFQGRSAR